MNIGTRACAEAAPDGYTFCVLSGEPVVYNQFTFKSLPFNPEKDFEPVINLFINANALVVNSSLNVKTIPELVALAKAKPGTLSYGTFSFMLAYFMDKLNKKNGIDIVRVPFRSGNEMVNAVMARHDADRVPRPFQHDRPDQERAVHRPRAELHRALAAVPRHPDLAGGDRRGLSAAVVRAVRAGRHAAADRRQAARRGRCGSPAMPDWRQRNFIDRAVEPATGPRDEFIKFIAGNRAFAARIAKESDIEPH